VSGRPRNPTDKLLQRLTQTPEGRAKIREAVERMKQREQWEAAQS
jgi:DNA-binding MarR family transcriptional regulator